jgi:hypothetical protein
VDIFSVPEVKLYMNEDSALQKLAFYLSRKKAPRATPGRSIIIQFLGYNRLEINHSANNHWRHRNILTRPDRKENLLMTGRFEGVSISWIYGTEHNLAQTCDMKS